MDQRQNCIHVHKLQFSKMRYSTVGIVLGGHTKHTLRSIFCLSQKTCCHFDGWKYWQKPLQNWNSHICWPIFWSIATKLVVSMYLLPQNKNHDVSTATLCSYLKQVKWSSLSNWHRVNCIATAILAILAILAMAALSWFEVFGMYHAPANTLWGSNWNKDFTGTAHIPLELSDKITWDELPQ